MKSSNVIDYDDPSANMYGCQPCPKCGDTHRAVFDRSNAATIAGQPLIECDACGHAEEPEARP